LAALLFLSLVASLAITYNLSTRKVSAKTQEDERQLEISIPKHVPLGIKIRKDKEKNFKDLNNENWARDFELEITNKGDKPIYSLSFLLILDVKDSSGQNVIAPVSFGRVELSDHRVRANPEDVPIKPGESVNLKIHSGQVAGWEVVGREQKWQRPKRVTVKFKNLSFGDGTGYMGPAGTPVPRKISTTSLNHFGPQQNKNGPRALDWLNAILSSKLKQSLSVDLPGKRTAGKFFICGFRQTALCETAAGAGLLLSRWMYVPNISPTGYLRRLPASG